jgi:hypothetical protein
MSLRSRCLVLVVLANAVIMAFSTPAGAKTPAHCRILTFDGAAGAASFDKVTFRAVDAFGVELDRSCLNQVQTSETAQHFAQRLPGDWGDGQCVAPVPTPTPPADPLNNTCGNGSTGASCKHKYKLKNGAATVRVCCYEGPTCKGNKLGKTSPSRLPMSIQQKKDPAPAFGPTPVPIAVGADQVALDPIGLTQGPFRASEGCRDKLSKAILAHATNALRRLADCHALQMKDALPPATDCNSVNPGSDFNGAIAASRSNVSAVATAQCVPGGVPARLGYQHLCPAPCAAINRCTEGMVGGACSSDADCDTSLGAGDGLCGPGGDWTQEVDCLNCLVEDAASTAIADKYGSVGAGPSPEAQKCQKLIGDSLTVLVGTLGGVTVDCQKRLDAGKLALVFCQNGQCSGPPSQVGVSCTKDEDCIDPSARLCKYADMNATRAQAEAKIAAKIPSGCDAGTLAELTTCGGTNPAAVSACIIANGRTVADKLADAQYPEGVGRTPCVPGPLCATQTPGGPTPSATPGPLCGNGMVDAGEDCDPPGSACPGTGPGFVCDPTCQCACPTSLDFTAGPGAAGLDLGWTGMGHDQHLVSDTRLTVAVAGCQNASRPCGVCTFNGPLPNVGPGAMPNHRCTGDTRTVCTSNADCSVAGGTCEFYFGSYLPINTTGFCIANQVLGPVTGTYDVESGSMASTLKAVWRVYTGVYDHPCPSCDGDATPNDGVAGGTCTGGKHNGLACDGGGVSGNVHWGTTSLDCPPIDGNLILSAPIDLANGTGTRSKTLSAASPNCRATGFTALKCFCDTCASLAAEPCSSNADCTGGRICGGLRCQGGGNAGGVCTVAGANSQCPGGSCGRPGLATAANQCDDQTCSPNPGDPDGSNEGVCAAGPTDFFCGPTATFYPCTSDFDCASYPGNTCSISKQRECFTDNGMLGASIMASGAPDAPVNDQADPKLGALFCYPPAIASSFNVYQGAPGLGRLEVPVHARALP